MIFGCKSAGARTSLLLPSSFLLPSSPPPALGESLVAVCISGFPAFAENDEKKPPHTVVNLAYAGFHSYSVLLPLSPSTALGGSALPLLNQIKRPMDRSPWALKPTHKQDALKHTHCAGWAASFYFPLIDMRLFNTE